MSNNYPPGMRESDIPGFNDWETTEERSCGIADAVVVTMDTAGLYVDIGWALEYLYKHQKGAKFIGERDYFDLAIDTLRRTRESIEKESYEVTAETCPFKGEVDVLYSEGKMFWECPLCHVEHDEEEIDFREFYNPEIHD
jgi:hypothetical protein